MVNSSNPEKNVSAITLVIPKPSNPSKKISAITPRPKATGIPIEKTSKVEKTNNKPI